MKFYLLQLGHSHSENTLHVFDTAPERDAKTIEVIFGPDGLCQQTDAEAWDKYREELNDTGSVEFEGDPGLEWFTAHPPDPEMFALRLERDKIRSALLRVTGSLGLIIKGAKPDGTGHRDNYEHATAVLDQTY